MSVLTDNIQRLAKLKSMSLQEVASKSGLSKNIIYRWKGANSSPSQASVTSIAKTLGVTYEDLAGIKKQKTPTKIDVKEAIHDDDVIMTFEGRPIPPEDLELMKRLLRGGHNEK